MATTATLRPLPTLKKLNHTLSSNGHKSVESVKTTKSQSKDTEPSLSLLSTYDSDASENSGEKDESTHEHSQQESDAEEGEPNNTSDSTSDNDSDSDSDNDSNEEEEAEEVAEAESESEPEPEPEPQQEIEEEELQPTQVLGKRKNSPKEPAKKSQKKRKQKRVLNAEEGTMEYYQQLGIKKPHLKLICERSGIHIGSDKARYAAMEYVKEQMEEVMAAAITFTKYDKNRVVMLSRDVDHAVEEVARRKSHESQPWFAC